MREVCGIKPTTKLNDRMPQNECNRQNIRMNQNFATALGLGTKHNTEMLQLLKTTNLYNSM